MVQRVLLFAFVCLQLTVSSDSARILGVFSFPSPSHYFLANALMKGLAEAGHDVTIIAPFKEKDPPKNGKWREIIVENVMEGMKDQFSEKKRPSLWESSNPVFAIFFMNKVGNTVTEGTLQNAEVQRLIHSNEKFDVVIVQHFVNDAMKGLAPHFNAHLILFAPVNLWFNHFVGNPSMPSYHPDLMLNFPPQMSFFQRLKNTLYKFCTSLNSEFLAYPAQNELMKKYIPNAPELDDILYNVSLVLLNSHPSISVPLPTVPCIIEIGGFHLKPPKELPEDLQSYLDNAKEGVIYFSMGSNLKSKDLPTEKRDAILKAFAKRKESILWKWEDDVLPGKPPNVKLGKWLPQQDILAHPNIKVFITHGGMLSTTETVYHGVPIVAIPILGDQKSNAKSAEVAGYGIALDFNELTEDKLTSALDEIIMNPKYRENVKQRSAIMKDRQVKPIDNAVYWVEYIIRHNGARHLRVPYLDHLSWYQYYLLDVIGFIFVVIFAVILVLKKIILYLFRRKSDKQKVKKQ